MKKSTFKFNFFFLSALLILAQVPLQAQDPLRFKEEVNTLLNINFKPDTAKNIILFTGSSSMRLWKDYQSYFPGKTIINSGFGGSHMSDLLFYAEPLIFRYSPKQIFIYEGDNDIGDKENPDSILTEAKMLVEKIKLRLPSAEIVFISPKPSILRWNLSSEYKKLNGKLNDFASGTDHVKFLDIWPVMLGNDLKPKSDLFLEDGLHMNKAGYDLWAKEIRKLIK